MIEVGAYEARTHFSALIDKVSNGEEVVITRRGTPVARLIPEGQRDRAKISEAIEDLRAWREEANITGLDWKELRDEGRR